MSRPLHSQGPRHSDFPLIWSVRQQGQSVEIIYADPYYGSMEEGTYDFVLELRAELAPVDSEASLRPTDCGLGADFPAVLVEIFRSVEWPVLTASGAMATFLLGEKIKKNLDAWLEIAAKLKKVVARRPPTFIDSSAAILRVLQGFSREDLCDLVEATVVVTYGTRVPHGDGSLGKTPYAFYVISLVFADRAHVFGVRSTGEIVFEHLQRLTWYDFNQ